MAVNINCLLCLEATKKQRTKSSSAIYKKKIVQSCIKWRVLRLRANIIDPDEVAHRSHLILLYTVWKLNFFFFLALLGFNRNIFEANTGCNECMVVKVKAFYSTEVSSFMRDMAR